MTKLKLESSPVRKLEVELPDGKTVTLTLRRILKKDSAVIERQSKEYEMEYNAGKISSEQFYDKEFQLIVEDYDPKDFEDVEISHMQLIAEEIKKLSVSKEPAEKKSLG